MGGNSRGQVYSINDTTKTATLNLNADLGLYVIAVGSAQRLSNGNFGFSAGNLLNGSGSHHEVVPNPLPGGTANYLTFVPTPFYRAIRMRDMYTYLD